MSHYSKTMLGAAIAVELAYIGFFILMTDGLSLGARSPTFMAFSVLGFLAAVAVVVFGQQMISKPPGHAFPDEREEMLEAKSEQSGARILEGGVLAVAALAIYQAAAAPDSLGSYSLTRPEGVVFAMVTIISIAAVGRMLLALVWDQRP